MREKISRSVYIGPNIPFWGMRRNMIFKGDIQMPDQLRELVKKKPVINALFVLPSELNNALRRVHQKGSLENIANNELIALARSQRALIT